VNELKRPPAPPAEAAPSAKRRTLLKFSFASATGVTLAACGGGSADGSQAIAAVPPPPGNSPTPPTTTPTPTPPTGSNPPTAQTPTPAPSPAPSPSPGTPAPTDPATPPPAPPVRPVSGFFSSWQPVQYTALSYIGNNDNGPAYSGKHTTWAQHPNGRSYMFGGDVTTSATPQMWSLNASLWNTTTPSSGWRLEASDLPLDNNYWPWKRDKTAVAWDSKRRVFWDVGGYNMPFSSGTVPPNKLPIYQKCASFDPAKPLNTRWTPTTVTYQTQGLGTIGGERVGPAVYDPVLDFVIHGGDGGSRLHFFDPATPGNEKFAFTARFDNPELEIVADGWYVHVVTLDPVNRWVWVVRGNMFGNKTMNICRITLPNSRSGLPTDGSSVNWTSRATSIWTNPSSGYDTAGGCVIVDGQVRKQYFWLRGPKGSETQSGVGGWGNNFKYGVCGRPEAAIGGNAPYPSPNTGLLVDLMTGAEEYTQFPHMQYADGQGWIIPTATWYDAKGGFLVYGIADESDAPTTSIKARHYVMRRKPVPSWVATLPLNAWYAIPGSNCEANLPADIRNVWSGPEASGYRNCELNYSQSPWKFSGMAFRRRDSICLFHGGGGSNGRGNGVLGFQLNSETPGWTLPMPPTPRSQTITQYNPGTFNAENTKEFNHTSLSASATVESNPRTPVAVHSYTSCTFIDSEDLWLRFGSQMVYPTDQGVFNGVHGFWWSESEKPYSSRAWTINAKATMPTAGIYPNRHYAKHPWREDVIGGSGGVFHLYRLASNTWTSRVNGDAFSDYRYGPTAIDPVNDVCLFAGIPGDLPPGLIELDTLTVRTGGSWVGPAAGEFQGSDARFTWDDDNQCLWALKARNGDPTPLDTSFDLFKITLANKAACQWRVEKVVTGVAGGSSRPDFTNLDESISNRFQWVPELGGLVLSTSYRRPIWFIKTSNKA